MFAIVRKSCLALVLATLVLAAGQGAPLALAQSQDLPETPLYPGLTWSAPVAATQTIRTSVNGDTLSLAGERVQAQEQFAGELAEGVLSFYSNAALAASGWTSYDAFRASDGAHFVFSHESGVYLSVEYLTCPADPGSLCVALWKSEPVESPGTAAAPQTAVPTAAGSFSKTSPSNGATGQDPRDTRLTWASSTNVDRYAYCVQQGSACNNSDPDWTSSFDRDVTLTDLLADKTYYWQVRATDCDSCTPKPWTYANSGTAWTFKTKAGAQVTILGNVGVGGGVLSWTDGSAKTTTADSTGAYSLRVTSGWTGTITPSKTGYTFSPPSASFTNVTATQTIQNFAATAVYTISGNTGTAGVTLSYTNVTAQTVTSDANGNYSISLPQGWAGTITPSKTAYSFTPASRTYTALAANQTAQNYTATFITYTISGNAGTGGATLTYVDGGMQFATADSSGSYTITVPFGWSGTVTPHKLGFSFAPPSLSYTSLAANQTAQNFTASACSICADKDTTGVFRPSNGLLYLKNLNITGFADVAINYGLAGDYPVVGDWDGDGTATIGVYRNGGFYLRNSNTVGFADLVFLFGTPGDQPVAGDWNNDGIDTIGIYRPSTAEFQLRNSNSAGAADMTFTLGNPGDVAIAGDWNGDGIDTTGVFRPSNGIIFLKNANTTGIADVGLNYGVPGDKPVTGDWNNDGIDTIGVYRGNIFYLRNSNTVGFADIVFALGLPGDMPIAGDWDNLP